VQAGEGSHVETLKAKYVINCGGLFADKLSAMVDDSSFTIKPRLGEYLLLHKNQGVCIGVLIFRSF
jgi:glycerol-3-phosphate dehydrogenase